MHGATQFVMLRYLKDHTSKQSTQMILIHINNGEYFSEADFEDNTDANFCATPTYLFMFFRCCPA